MLVKENLRQKLLNTGLFIDNAYLEDYLNLVLNYNQPRNCYTEKHHIIQVAYYKHLYKCKSREEAEKWAELDQDNACINLLYMDHCKAHWLLYFCTKSYLKQGNEKAVRYIVEIYKKLTNKNKEIIKFNDNDFKLLQSYMDSIIKDPESRYYSTDEEEILKKYYPEFGIDYCLQFFPNRSKDAVRRYVSKLKLKRTNVFWTDEEEAFLKENYPKYGIDYCMKKLNRTRLMIKCKANYMGLRVVNLKKYNRPWTESELKILQDNYEIIGPNRCVELLPMHEKTAIQKRASMLGLHYKRGKK